MPNIFNSIGTDWLSEVVLDEYTTYLAPLGSFTTDVAGTPSFRGETVKVLAPHTASGALTLAAGSSWTIQDIGSDIVSVTMNSCSYTSFQLHDIEYRGSQLLTVEAFIRSKVAALANSIVSGVFSLVSGSSAISYLWPLTSVSASGVSTLNLQLDNVLCPSDNRSIILNNAYSTRLRQDSALSNASAFGQDSVIKKGIIPSIDKCSRVFQTSVLPTNGNLAGILVHPTAVVYASRVVEPQDSKAYNVYKILEDADSNASLTLMGWYDANAAAQKVVLACNWGATFNNVSGSLLLKSA